MEQQTKPLISVFIIAYNQAHKIKPAIQSVLWADEVVLVDSHSTDGTAEIAAELGARVVQVEFNGFGDLRNKALAACKHEWIFSLDSDERCTTTARDEILSIISSATAKDYYFVPRRNYFMGRMIRYSGWYPDYRQPQLFRRGKMSYSADRVHETYVAHTDNGPGYMKKAILQVPYSSLEEMLQKANRYSSLGVDRLEKKNKKASMFKAITHGGWSFFRHYIIKLGILDGMAGLTIAMGNAYGTYFRYAKYCEHVQDWSEPAAEIIERAK